jgi:hypothetical protein
MNRTSQLLCAWSGPLFLVLFGIGMVPLAGFIPPPTAHDSAQEIVKLYSEHTDRLRAGLVLMMIGAAFIGSWTAAVSVQLKRIEGRFSPMTYTQVATGAAGILVVIFPVMIMIVTSFRPERDPQLTQALNDLAWIPFIMVFSPVLVQMLAVAFAVLTATPERADIYPRWVGYFSIWAALLLLPGSLIPFFKTGPFAWHGLFEFWLAAVVFFGWIAVMTIVTIRAIRQQEDDVSSPGNART